METIMILLLALAIFFGVGFFDYRLNPFWIRDERKKLKIGEERWFKTIPGGNKEFAVVKEIKGKTVVFDRYKVINGVKALEWRNREYRIDKFIRLTDGNN